MTSLLKRRSNRLNAQRSTGPRTAAGKARVAQNARKHGLRAPVLRDPAVTRNIGELGRKLAGPTAAAPRLEAACRLVAAQIELQNVRQARLLVLSHVLEDRTMLERLTTLDIYERDARARRKSAARDFGSVRLPPAAGEGTAGAPICAEVGFATVLQRLPSAETVSWKRRRLRMLSLRRSLSSVGAKSLKGRGGAMPRSSTAAWDLRYAVLNGHRRRNRFQRFPQTKPKSANKTTSPSEQEQ